MKKAMIIAVLCFCAGGGWLAVEGAAGGTDPTILTYPIGLVTGEHEIVVDLGTGGRSATLFLDGEPVCAMTSTDARCMVNFGDAPHVHLMELVQHDESGNVTGHADRWVNRPGQEAELVIQLEQRDPRGVCSGKALWSHPSKKNPVLLEVTENGRPLRIREDRRSFAFPCPDADAPHVLAASAIFPDGGRAEAVALSGGFGGSTDAGLTAIALSTDGEAGCGSMAATFDGAARAVENAGFEIVFVLDPKAGYRTLMASGWTKGMMPTTNSTTKQFDSMVQQGSKGSEAMPKNAWKRSESSLMDAEKMWLVLSNKDLQRANGFSQGKMNWLLLLFNYGSATIEGKPHIADAVAASGLVAAAGPWRRAVVLVLGNHPERDGSGFTSAQAQNYLAEVGVPLFVLRNGKLRDDGWPKGVPVKTMEAFADALEAVKSNIEGQCVTWFPGDMHPNQIAAALPDGVTVAGRTGAAFEGVEAVWRQAEISTSADDSTTEDADDGSASTVSGARVEVTAVSVLFAARDGQGQPVADVEESDVEVSEDGLPVRVLGLERIWSAESADAEVPPKADSPGCPATPGISGSDTGRGLH